MSQEPQKLRFRIKRRDYEVELEGDFEYVREKFETFSENIQHHLKQDAPLPATAGSSSEYLESVLTTIPSAEGLTGIVQYSSEGRPHLTVPADRLTAKEALALVLYATHPKPVGDDDLSGMLGSSWKTTSGAVVRARASELKREGKLIAEKGNYMLSGAGIQWVTSDLIPNLRKSV